MPSQDSQDYKVILKQIHTDFMLPENDPLLTKLKQIHARKHLYEIASEVCLLHAAVECIDKSIYILKLLSGQKEYYYIYDDKNDKTYELGHKAQTSTNSKQLGAGSQGEVVTWQGATLAQKRVTVERVVLLPDSGTNSQMAMQFRLILDAFQAYPELEKAFIIEAPTGIEDSGATLQVNLIMRCVRGSSLDNSAQQLTAQQVNDFTRRLLLLQRAGVLVTDIKPANLMLENGNIVKIDNFESMKPTEASIQMVDYLFSPLLCADRAYGTMTSLTAAQKVWESSNQRQQGQVPLQQIISLFSWFMTGHFLLLNVQERKDFLNFLSENSRNSSIQWVELLAQKVCEKISLSYQEHLKGFITTLVQFIQTPTTENRTPPLTCYEQIKISNLEQGKGLFR